MAENKNYVVHINNTEGNTLCGKINPDMSCGTGAVWAVKMAELDVCPKCENKYKKGMK